MITIAIIGAGLSGLTAASILKNHARVTIFEKSRGVGGRMATRRSEPFSFDHGAQFFKVRSDAFQSFINPMIARGIIKNWDARFVEIQERKIVKQNIWDEHYPHYVGVPAMNSIAKFIAADLDIQLGTQISALEKVGSHWALYDNNKVQLGQYDWVISAIPAEQASTILPQEFIYSKAVNSTKMKACFSLMLGFEQHIPLAFEAALVAGEDISWISVNSSKPERTGGTSLLIHSTNKWADRHINDDRAYVMDYLCSQLSDIIQLDISKASHRDIHAWRFANIDKQNGATHLIDTRQKIAVCGDWCIQGRVEAAFKSGYDSANRILELI